MIEKKKKIILSTRQELLNNSVIERATREGIELEKGSIITQEYLEKHEETLKKMDYFI